MPRLRPLAEPLALALLVLAQVLLFGRLVGTDTDYDEGVYLTSVDALEHGQRLGADVFAPQPPVFYLLLRAVSALGADSVRGFHWGMVLVAVGTCLAAYALARSLAGPLAGLTAAALLTIAPPFPLFAHRVLADIPPLALGLVALWLAVVADDRRSALPAAAGGAVVALAVATKPSAVLALVPFLLLLLWTRPGRLARLGGAAGGAAAVGLTLAVVYRDVLDELWQSVVVYHRDARDTPDVIDKQHELLTFLDPRTPFAWLVVLGLVGSLALVRRREDVRVWALWAWAAVAIAFLVAHHPLHYNHLLVLPVVLAVPAAVGLTRAARRLPWRDHRAAAIAVALVVVLAAGYVQQQRRIVLDQVPEEPELVAAAELLRRETVPDDLVVADHSIVPFLADRRVAGPLVDTATLRFETGSLTDAEVLGVLDEYRVAAVFAGRSLALRPELLSELARRYDERRIDAGRIFLRR